MDLNSLTIPPELFYSRTPRATWKLNKVETEEVIKPFKKTTTFKSKKLGKKFKISQPELGKIGKIRRAIIKKKPLKQKSLKKVLKEKSGNIIQHQNGIPGDHNQTNDNNNKITFKQPTKEEERLLRKEIKEKEEIIQKRLFRNENFQRKRLHGNSFKFFKSKNAVHDEANEPSVNKDDELVPEIRDFPSQPLGNATQIAQAEIHQQPEIAREVLNDSVPFEEEAEADLGNTTTIIESLLQNLDEPDVDPDVDHDASIPLPPKAVSSLESLIATLEGEPTAEKSQQKVEPAIKAKVKMMGFGKNQLQIDAGQKKFGLVECKECGFSYNTNVPEDEKMHNDRHQAATSIPRFRGWLTEDSMMINDWSEQNGRIIRLQPNHKNLNSEFVKEIVGKMEMDFGFQENYESQNVYLAVLDSKIVGLATVIDSVVAKKDLEEKRIRLGVQRLYVRPQFRRKGVAKAMLKTIAIMHHKGELLDVSQDFAFSSPTEEGKKLIQNVVGTSQVFIF